MASAKQKKVKPSNGALRFGLCCLFASEPIKFRTTTATAMLRLGKPERLARLGEICQHNAGALMASLEFCAGNGIGVFRVNSQILAIKTHPVAVYAVNELPGGAAIVESFRGCGAFARAHDQRLLLHPDQFVVLNSPTPKTLAT
jgi:UV DNA damage endonuclease